MKKVKLYLNYAGHCLANENDAIKGGRKKKIKFHALWGLINHPSHGYILFDTGYTSRFYKATQNYPNKLYAQVTKVSIPPEEEIKQQLIKHGINANEIKHVIISHFHADHVGGLMDFPNASIYCSKKAYDQVISIPRFAAFSKGILKDLIPADILERIVFVDENCEKVTDSILGEKFDLFGDDSLHLVPLPGHAAGQLGLILETDNHPYFLIADAAWFYKSVNAYILPNQIVRLFFYSWKDFKNSLLKLNKFHQTNKGVIIIPSHCSETTDQLVNDKINWDAL